MFAFLTATTPTPVPVSQVLEQGGTVISSMLGWITDIGNTIVNNGILFVSVGIFLLGGAIGVLGRLLSRG